jgi:hypothetical protein
LRFQRDVLPGPRPGTPNRQPTTDNRNMALISLFSPPFSWAGGVRTRNRACRFRGSG